MANPVQLRKWYFAINEAGFDGSKRLLAVAIRSCKAKTNLVPHCIYSGQNPAHIKWLESEGVQVIRHESSFAPILRAGYGDDYDVYCGHWLRVDIPLVEQEDTFVLYTDIDVMFMGQPSPIAAPRFLAAAPERYRWRWPHFNSGVMVLNLPGLRRVHDDFINLIERRMTKGKIPVGHDQVCYNAAFRWRHARLPHGMNWKPYWGKDRNARIVHFHGPKPYHVQMIQAKRGAEMLALYSRLYAIAPDAYRHYGALADAYGQ